MKKLIPNPLLLILSPANAGKEKKGPNSRLKKVPLLLREGFSQRDALVLWTFGKDEFLNQVDH